MGGEDHGRRAIAALQAVGLAESILDERQFAGAGGDAFDGGDRRSRRLHREHQAGAHGNTVEQHGAGAADAVLAAGMGALEAERVAQAVEQSGARLDVNLMHSAVDRQINAHGLSP